MNYRPCFAAAVMRLLKNVTVTSIVLVLLRARLALSPQIRCTRTLEAGRQLDIVSTGHFGRNQDDRGSVVILVGIDAELLDDIPALSSALVIALDDRASGEVVSFFFFARSVHRCGVCTDLIRSPTPHDG
jgi:hypothetical protein